MEKLIRIGMDTSKQVFQLHGVNAAEEPVLRRKLRRKEMVAFFQRLEPTVVGIEACGGAHHLLETEQMVRSIDPKPETIRGAQRCSITAAVFGSSGRANHLAQRSRATASNRPDIWLQAIRSKPCAASCKQGAVHIWAPAGAGVTEF